MIASKGGLEVVFELPGQTRENPIISQAFFATEKINDWMASSMELGRGNFAYT